MTSSWLNKLEKAEENFMIGGNMWKNIQITFLFYSGRCIYSKVLNILILLILLKHVLILALVGVK